MLIHPHYPLNDLKAGDTISVTFNMPNPIEPDTLSRVTGV